VRHDRTRCWSAARSVRPTGKRNVGSRWLHAHVYEVRPRKDRRGANLISDPLPFGRLWHTEARDAVDYAKFCSRSHDVVICIYNEA